MDRAIVLLQLPSKTVIGFILFVSFFFLPENLTMKACAQAPKATTAQVKSAAEAKAAKAKAAQEKVEQHRRNVAVALNYCRASFYRIRKYPTKVVMHQERQKILNNLNLNVIQDAEIIRLYSDVLDEIGQVQLSEKETELYDGKFKRSLHQKMTFDALSVGLNLVTASYLGAVRTGASSWWDYRNFQWTRDNELLKLEKSRVSSVVKKSTTFMDTFWKLAQKNDIPDRWLIRSTDLDDLEKAMNQRDPQVRLRILKRMEPFMECYPPYWYYLARTQQTIGQLHESMATYERLANLEEGHFRRDDMLATALANRAVIQAHLGQQLAAVETAKKSLSQSAQVWEANLACAKILQKAGELASAEDAILRNLDVGLEREQSTVTLLSFYYDTNNTTKLAKMLGDEKVIAFVPPPVLIRFASQLPKHQTPPIVWAALSSSMRIEPQLGFGDDSIVLVCHPVWKIARSKVALHFGDRIIEGEAVHQNDVDYIRFEQVAEFGGFVAGRAELPTLKLDIQYGDKEPILLSFSGSALLGEGSQGRNYRLIAAQWGKDQVAFVPRLRKTVNATEIISGRIDQEVIKTAEKIGWAIPQKEIKNALQESPDSQSKVPPVTR